MKALKFTLIVAAAAVVLGQTPADAGKGVAAREPGFNVAGVCTGPLSGTVVIGGEAVVIPKKVAILDTRTGRMSTSTSLTGRSLYVSGFVRGNKNVAALIIVGEPQSNEDFSAETMPNVLADPDRAR
jgi:hypothetical protein